MKTSLYLLAGAIILQSMTCEPDVTFYEPQPVDAETLKAIPKSYTGTYNCPKDRSFLEVKESMIITSLDYDYTIHQNDVDSTMVITGETIRDLETGEITPFTAKGDSLVLHINDVDTVFNFSKGHLIRKYKDACYLNISHDTEKWEVIKVEQAKNQLTFSRIDTEQELKQLIAITNMPQDTVPPYRFRATKSQFSKFVKNNGFRDQTVYVRR